MTLKIAVGHRGYRTQIVFLAFPDGVATGRREQLSKVSRTTAGGPRSPQFGTLLPIPPRQERSAVGRGPDIARPAFGGRV